MRATYRPGTRRWLLLPAAVLVLSGPAAGCSDAVQGKCQRPVFGRDDREIAMATAAPC